MIPSQHSPHCRQSSDPSRAARMGSCVTSIAPVSFVSTQLEARATLEHRIRARMPEVGGRRRWSDRMDNEPFQDLVDWRCYGCGRLNEQGFQIKSQWDGDEVVCRWQAQPFHVGLPGRLQGGVIATAIICHALWTATATASRGEGIAIEEPMPFAYSTTSLQLDFLEPIPVERPLTLRARVTDMHGEHATVLSTVYVGERETTRAQTEHRRIALPSCRRDRHDRSSSHGWTKARARLEHGPPDLGSPRKDHRSAVSRHCTDAALFRYISVARRRAYLLDQHPRGRSRGLHRWTSSRAGRARRLVLRRSRVPGDGSR